MPHHHPSRLVTLGANLAALAQAGTGIAMGLGSLAGAMIGAPFRTPKAGCGCECQRARCCYEPPIYRCGGC
jgi:hypothetical protein